MNEAIWYTWWFYIIIAFIILFFVYLFFQWKRKLESKHKLELETEIKAKTIQLQYKKSELENNAVVLKNNTKELEIKTTELRIKTIDLENKISELQEAHEKLIEDEQFVIMGKLIAGISHEVNTPLGIGVTGSSTITNDTENIDKLFKKNKLSKVELLRYIERTKENSQIILQNLYKADKHISGLKRISRDQISELPRRFIFSSYLDDIIQNLKHEWKDYGRKEDIFIIDCDHKMEIYSLPGAISQIFTNLIINSIRHGFKGQHNWKIVIAVKKHSNVLNIIYKDNGKGVEKQYLPDKIFEAFFTTNPDTDGSGLGLFITKDLVEDKLSGKIRCESKYGQGIEFIISIKLLN